MQSSMSTLYTILSRLCISPTDTRPQASSRRALYVVNTQEHLCSLIFSLTRPHSRTGAANRFPDKVEKDPEGTRQLNVEATGALARLCASQGVFLVYISTDYVFSGKPGEAPYEADAPTGPTNLYGQTKLDGEHAVLQEYRAAGKDGLGVVLRVPVLYGDAELPSESAVNVLMDAVWKAQQGEKVMMEHWALRYPTNTEDIGRVCHGKLCSSSSTGTNISQLTMAQTWLSNTWLPATANVHSCRRSYSFQARTSTQSTRCVSCSRRSWAST